MIGDKRHTEALDVPASGGGVVEEHSQPAEAGWRLKVEGWEERMQT